jgi:hypothetical protein
MGYTRREMLASIGLAGLGAAVPPLIGRAATSSRAEARAAGEGGCPFRLAVINDEITQDFEKACGIVSGDFGLHWIELRSMWNKNVTELEPKQIEESRKIIAAHKLRVTDIASPLFKTDWPGAPRSSQSETRDQFHADFDASAQDKLLERCILYCVSRDFIKTCQTPMLVLPDDVPAHPLQTSIDVASLAPNAEITVFPWKEPEELKQRTIDRVRRFLRARIPMRAAAR